MTDKPVNTIEWKSVKDTDIKYAVVYSSMRKWWQFWKPKYLAIYHIGDK